MFRGSCAYAYAAFWNWPIVIDSAATGGHGQSHRFERASGSDKPSSLHLRSKRRCAKRRKNYEAESAAEPPRSRSAVVLFRVVICRLRSTCLNDDAACCFAAARQAHFGSCAWLLKLWGARISGEQDLRECASSPFRAPSESR